MPQLDTHYFSSQIFWLLISFGLLFLVVRYLFIPRMRHIINVRNLNIEEKLQQTKNNISKIHQLEEYYTNEIARIQERVMDFQKVSQKQIENTIVTQTEALNLELALEYQQAKDNIKNKKHIDIDAMAQTISGIIIKKFYNHSFTGKL
jgi:F-type H+-transporting ATPase subunit b